MPDAEAIALALGGRRSGACWTARCPAHDDQNPSLSITQREGRVLVCCRAGCPQAAVLGALRDRGLWPSAGAVRRTSTMASLRATALREVERRERAAGARAHRATWLEALAKLRRAGEDIARLHALLRDDPEERDPRTTAALDALGDPYMRELLAEQELDLIEAAERERREGLRRAAA